MNVDAELILACKNDDREAIHKLYTYCHGQMIGIGLRYLKDRNDAVAAFHKSFMKILNGLSSYSEQQNFMAWAKRIMVNTCIDTFRKNSKHLEREYPFDPADYYYKNASVDWNLAEMNMRTADLLEMIQSLPEKSRQVFNLYVFEDFKHHEIADILGMSEGTSKWHLSKARKVLQQKLMTALDRENKKLYAS